MSTVTRTIKSYECSCLAIEIGQDGKKNLVSVSVIVPAAADNTARALKAAQVINPAVVMVEAMTEKTALYGMDEADFIKYGKVAEARSKETRNTISKEVVAKLAVCTAIVNREIVTEKHFIPNRFTDCVKATAYARKHFGQHIVTVDEIEEVKTLVYMPVDDFITHAEIMPERKAKEEG